MRKRYFTVDETTDMIPDLERAFGRILQVYALIRESYEFLDEYDYAPDDESFDAFPDDAPEEVGEELATLRMLLDALHEEIDTVQATGCFIKRLDAGCVDWYAMHNGREVMLSWQLGEKRVSHWYEVDADHDARQPLRSA